MYGTSIFQAYTVVQRRVFGRSVTFPTTLQSRILTPFLTKCTTAKNYLHLLQYLQQTLLCSVRLNMQVLKRETFLKKIQRTGHLLVWDDTSTVANHGYMAVLVSCLYDSAVYLTDEEYQIKTGKTANTQRIIEEPQLHIVARCSGGDVEQLAYSETWQQCISELQQNVATSEQIEFVDILRMTSADHQGHLAVVIRRVGTTSALLVAYMQTWHMSWTVF